MQETRTRLDADTAAALSKLPRTVRRDLRHAEHVETKRMKLADERSELVGAVLEAEAAAAAAEESLSTQQRLPDKPLQLFQPGQSVHAWWAPWFPKCGPGQNPAGYSKKLRPSWFSSEVVTVAGWEENLPYAGSFHTGWAYIVY